MNPAIVRYKTRPESAEKNQKLIERVFSELAQTKPGGLKYTAFRFEDGVSFVHIATVTTVDGSNPLGASKAFAEFQTGIRDRCVEPPAPSKAQAVGNYGCSAPDRSKESGYGGRRADR